MPLKINNSDFLSAHQKEIEALPEKFQTALRLHLSETSLTVLAANSLCQALGFSIQPGQEHQVIGQVQADQQFALRASEAIDKLVNFARQHKYANKSELDSFSRLAKILITRNTNG